MAAPTVTSISPTTGNTAGGTLVTITGTGFTGTTGVTFGGTAATVSSIVSDTSLKVVTPAHAAGNTNVVVTNATGSNTPDANDVYAYAVVATATYTQPDGGANGVTYYEDEVISAATLASGELQKRFDTWVYPQVNLTQAPKQGGAGSPNTAPAAANSTF